MPFEEVEIKSPGVHYVYICIKKEPEKVESVKEENENEGEEGEEGAED